MKDRSDSKSACMLRFCICMFGRLSCICPQQNKRALVIGFMFGSQPYEAGSNVEETQKLLLNALGSSLTYVARRGHLHSELVSSGCAFLHQMIPVRHRKRLRSSGGVSEGFISVALIVTDVARGCCGHNVLVLAQPCLRLVVRRRALPHIPAGRLRKLVTSAIMFSSEHANGGQTQHGATNAEA